MGTQSSRAGHDSQQRAGSPAAVYTQHGGRFIPLLQIKCIQAERIESKAGKAVQLPEVALM